MHHPLGGVGKVRLRSRAASNQPALPTSCRWVARRGHLKLVRKGAAQPIQISAEKRQGNKMVTKVSGSPAATGLLFADSCRLPPPCVRLGCGLGISPFPAAARASSRSSTGRLLTTRPPSPGLCSQREGALPARSQVAGVEDFLVDPDQLAGELKSLLAGSATVDDAPGGGAGKVKREVFVQGAHQQKVADYLERTYGVPKKFLSVKKSK